MSEQKYTLQQYAQMQGGHEMEENDKSLSFMQSLGEARMYKSRSQIATVGSNFNCASSASRALPTAATTFKP